MLVVRIYFTGLENKMASPKKNIQRNSYFQISLLALVCTILLGALDVWLGKRLDWYAYQAIFNSIVLLILVAICITVFAGIMGIRQKKELRWPQALVMLFALILFLWLLLDA